MSRLAYVRFYLGRKIFKGRFFRDLCSFLQWNIEIVETEINPIK
jgi:hypothetical protein